MTPHVLLRALPPDAYVLAAVAPDTAGIEGVIGAYGPVALLGAFILAVLTGGLVPRSVHRKTEDRAERWEAVALEALRQNGRLIPTAEVAVDVLRQLPQAVASTTKADAP